MIEYLVTVGSIVSGPYPLEMAVFIADDFRVQGREAHALEVVSEGEEVVAVTELVVIPIEERR